jgi:hypothetical protein
MKKLIIPDLSDSTYEKIKRLRNDDGFGERTWGAWFNYRFKNESTDDSSQVTDTETRDAMLSMWCLSFAKNIPELRSGNTITELVPVDPEKHNGPSLIVGAGPSIWKHKHLDLLQDAIKSGKYKGIVCATDKMLVPLLERNIIPEFTVGVDGSPIIKKFYDHPLVEKYGPQIKAVLSSTTDRIVTDVCIKNKVNIYWFNPLYDDPFRSNESFTKLQRLMTTTEKHPQGVVAMCCGGNCGCAAWTISHTLLRRANIALIGIDMGYPEGTNLEETPYFSCITQCEHPAAVVDRFYGKIYNPAFKTYCFVDKIFSKYRESWRSAALKLPAHIKTYNCSEEGSLFGERIICEKFSVWLKSVEGQE